MAVSLVLLWTPNSDSECTSDSCLLLRPFSHVGLPCSASIWGLLPCVIYCISICPVWLSSLIDLLFYEEKMEGEWIWERGDVWGSSEGWRDRKVWWRRIIWKNLFFHIYLFIYLLFISHTIHLDHNFSSLHSPSCSHHLPKTYTLSISSSEKSRLPKDNDHYNACICFITAYLFIEFIEYTTPNISCVLAFIVCTR